MFVNQDLEIWWHLVKIFGQDTIQNFQFTLKCIPCCHKVTAFLHWKAPLTINKAFISTPSDDFKGISKTSDWSQEAYPSPCQGQNCPKKPRVPWTNESISSSSMANTIFKTSTYSRKLPVFNLS